jgi:hypothetical protein
LLAVLKLSETAPGVLARGDVMLHCMTNDPLFASSDPTAADFQADLEDLRSKQARRNTGPGAIEARNGALAQVKRNMESFRFFVQRLADNDPERAAEIITAAGMYVRKVTVPTKADLAIQQGLTSGTATAIATSRGRGATYWWEVSGDQKSWEALPCRRRSRRRASPTSCRGRRTTSASGCSPGRGCRTGARSSASW